MQHTNTNKQCLSLLIAAVAGGSVIWLCLFAFPLPRSSEPSALLWFAVPAALSICPGWCAGLLIMLVTAKMGIDANNFIFWLALATSFFVGIAVSGIILFYVGSSMAALDGLSG